MVSFVDIVFTLAASFIVSLFIVCICSCIMYVLASCILNKATKPQEIPEATYAVSDTINVGQMEVMRTGTTLKEFVMQKLKVPANLAAEPIDRPCQLWPALTVVDDEEIIEN